MPSWRAPIWPSHPPQPRHRQRPHLPGPRSGVLPAAGQQGRDNVYETRPLMPRSVGEHRIGPLEGEPRVDNREGTTPGTRASADVNLDDGRVGGRRRTLLGKEWRVVKLLYGDTDRQPQTETPPRSLKATCQPAPLLPKSHCTSLSTKPATRCFIQGQQDLDFDVHVGLPPNDRSVIAEGPDLSVGPFQVK